MAITTNSASVNQSFGESESQLNATTPNPYNLQSAVQFGSGTGTNNFDLPIFICPVASRSIATSASNVLNFASYADQQGTTITAAGKLKFLAITNTGTVSIQIGGVAANPLFGPGFLDTNTSTITIVAGQTMMWAIPSGMTIDGTHKNLNLLNLSGATIATFQLYALMSTV
jgi:hypothetical protein